MPATSIPNQEEGGGSVVTNTTKSSIVDNLQPPASANKWQLSQFHKVLNRRKQHLNRLNEVELNTLHDLVLETLYGSVSGSGGGAGRGGASKTINSSLAKVIEPLPHSNLQQQPQQQQANNKSKLLSENILFGLVSAFHVSVNNKLTSEYRKEGLVCVKAILDGIEVARKDAVRRRLEEEKELREKGSRPAAASSATSAPADKATTAATATATATTSAAQFASSDKDRQQQQQQQQQQQKQGMGLSISTTSGARNQQNAADDDDSDDEIIVLDGPPTPPPGGRKDKPSRSSRPLPKPKEEGDVDMDMNGDQPAAAPANTAATTATAAPIKPRHKQTTSRPAKYKTLTARGDTSRPSYSASLHPRPSARVTVDTSEDPRRGTKIDEITLDDVRARLVKWDPYWDVVHEFTTSTDGGGGLEWGTRTGPVSKYEEIGKRPAGGTERYEFKTAGMTTLNIASQDSDVRAKLLSPSSAGRTMKWGSSAEDKNSRSYSTGDRRCILRMLPLYKTDEARAKHRKKRADTHLWPVGTFLQLNNSPIHLVQRKQQSHDHALWKGMCHTLDLTRHVKDIRISNDLEIFARDDTLYAVHVAVCDYVGPDALYERLMTRNGPQAIRRYEYDEALKVALNYVKNQMVVLDSDHEDDDGEEEHETVQTFSLLCPVSMAAIETPVRGTSCRHIACFDLRNWLHGNVTIGGTRWRCAHCENFLSPSDLVLDGMFARFLHQHKGEVSSARDKIQLRPDGTWSLMDENRLRYQSKKRSSGDNIGGNGAATKRSKVEPGAPTPPDNSEHEVIELL